MISFNSGNRLILCLGLLLAPIACGATAPSPAAPANQVHAEPPRPAPQRSGVERAIAEMVSHDVASKFDVLAQTEVIQNWFAVAIDPPYREFPNVVLFHWNGGEWVRTMEGLGVGVQPYPSPYLDLHVARAAYDLTIDGGQPMSESTIRKLHSVGRRTGVATVIHHGLTHHHRAGRESYFLDRRPAHEALGKLYPAFAPADTGEVSGPPSCLFVDYPPLAAIELRAEGTEKVLVAKTRSGQEWQVSWKGIDDDGRLVGRVFAFRWSSARAELLPRDLAAAPAACTSALPSKLVEELELRALQARHCRPTPEEGTPDKHGTLEVHVQVDQQGQAQYVKVEADSFGVPEVSQCVNEAFRGPYLTAPGTSCGERHLKVVLGSRF
jgi:hypothetical protein